MKKFIFRTIIFGLIAFGIYFFMIGNGISDLWNDTSATISTSRITELRDQVLGSFSNEDKSFAFEDNVEEEAASSSEEESTSIINKQGPLSEFLSQFRGFGEDEENKEIKTNNEEESVEEIRTIPQIEENTNLPDFDLVCFPEVKRLCGFDECSTLTLDITFLLLDSGSNLIHKCSSSDCKTFNYQGRAYSDYYNYQIQTDDDVFMITRELKVDSNSRTAYAEVRTNGINTTINLGRCLGQ